MRRKRTILDPDELIPLFDTLATGDAGQIKAVRKTLEQSRYSRRGSLEGKRARIFLLEQIVRITASERPLNRAALLRGLVAFGFNAVHLIFTETVQLVLAEIQHSNGAVREAVRRLADYLSMEVSLSSLRKTEERKKEYQAFVHAIGALLIKHRGAIVERHVEKLKPSIYRSLALLWERANSHGSVEPWVSPEESAKYEPPIHEYNDPFWVDKNELDPEEIENELWIDYHGGDPDQALPAITGLEHESCSRLAGEMTRIGFLKRDVDAVVASLRTFSNDYSPSALARLLQQAYAAKRIRIVEEFSGVVRALQGYANHRVQMNANDEPFTDFLVNAMLAREEYGRHKPEDFAVFAETAAAAHKAIDAFFDERTEERKRAREDLEKRMRLHGVADNNADHTWTAYASELRFEIQSIAHHALDWYCQVEPWNACRPEPRKLGAIAVQIVKRANEEYRHDRPRFISEFTSAELSAFGGWKSPGAINDAALGACSAVMRNAIDPELFFVITPEPD
jgi:hypothetical protein